jgi:hypothetical protein
LKELEKIYSVNENALKVLSPSATFFWKRSTRPSVSTSFWRPVKNGMAAGADFHADVALVGGPGLERAPAGAD